MANSFDGLQFTDPNGCRVAVITIFEPLANGLIDHVSGSIIDRTVPTGNFENGENPSLPNAVFELVTDHTNNFQDFSSLETMRKIAVGVEFKAKRRKMVIGLETIYT